MQEYSQSKSVCTMTWHSSNFAPLLQFYNRHSGSIGVLWILKRNASQKISQMFLNTFMGTVFIMAWIPTMIDIVRTPTIETFAVSVNMCSSGTNDFVLWCVMVMYRNDIRTLLEYCEGLHRRQTEKRMITIADEVFEKCAKVVLICQR